MQTSPLIELYIDHQRRRAIMTLPTDVSGARLARAVARLLSEHLTVASYDWVVDSMANPDVATKADVDEVTTAYLSRVRGPGRKYTCVITRDLGFHLAAASVDHKFK